MSTMSPGADSGTAPGVAHREKTQGLQGESAQKK